MKWRWISLFFIIPKFIFPILQVFEVNTRPFEYHILAEFTVPLLCRLKRVNYETRNRGWKKQKTTLNRKWRRSIHNQASCLTLLHFLLQIRLLGASWYPWSDIPEYQCGSSCLQAPSIHRKTTFFGHQSPELSEFITSPALLLNERIPMYFQDRIGWISVLLNKFLLIKINAGLLQ